MVPLIPLPPAPPALDFGGNKFDCWILVGGFKLDTADVSAANLFLPRFADQLETAFKMDKSLAEPGAELLNMNGERFKPI